MADFQVVRLPVLTTEGTWMTLPPSLWTARLQNYESLSVRGKTGFVQTLSFGDLLAVGIDAENHVSDYGKTFRRMALTGIGTSMMSKGRLDGWGAGLLDLRFQGTETSCIVSGRMVFTDSAVIGFKMLSHEFDAFASNMPEHIFSSEAVEDSAAMFDLLERMKIDGKRVIPELLGNVLDAKNSITNLLSAAEVSTSFGERDEIRHQTAVAEYNYFRQKKLFASLLFDLGVDPLSLAGQPEAAAIENIFELKQKSPEKASNAFSADNVPPKSPDDVAPKTEHVRPTLENKNDVASDDASFTDSPDLLKRIWASVLGKLLILAIILAGVAFIFHK